MPRFVIEQLAFAPAPERTDEALAFLMEIGMKGWVEDTVTAKGTVFGEEAVNVADLFFHYPEEGPREIEVLSYEAGKNWLEQRRSTFVRSLHEQRRSTPDRFEMFRPVVSHIGMHVSEEDLEYWREWMKAHDVRVAQEVRTVSHTNPVIAGKRLYHYVIFETRHIIGVDMKFIVRREVE